MATETLLKKDFKSSDVTRVRNLVKKDFSSATKTGAGYSKANTFHEEGDIWEEAGRTWTIKNGIKQNITKLDKAKDTVRVPLKCPKCGGSMKHWLAKKMYRIHGFCFDPCTVEYEAELRKAGLYEQYEKRMIEGNMKAFVRDLEQWAFDFMSSTDSFVTEEGDVEEWKSDTSKQKLKVLKNIKEFTEVVNSHIG